MKYLILGDDFYIIEEEIKKILDKNKVDSKIIKYDLSEVPIDRVIDELDTYDFFTKKKIVLGKNALFLTSEKSNIENNTDRLLKYLDSKDENNILILTASSLDNRKKIVSSVTSKMTLIKPSEDKVKYIKNNLEDYFMDTSTITYLIEYCNSDIGKIYNELNKLKNYKLEEKIITKEDIDNIVTKSIDTNIFSLIDAIIYKNKKKSYEIYNELIKHEEIYKIMIILANQFRLMYQVKVLKKYYNSDEEISKYLKVHKYAVQIAREKGYNYQEEDLIKYLLTLANLDYDIKTGKTIKEASFVMFIMSI